jgi:crotonobetainyl-CoA:carnitine CoA-transferase CaiB-like acyl-CoA transferase
MNRDSDIHPPAVLDGVRVLELARVGPPAFCTMMLGDFGAEVIKVETPGKYGETFGTGNSPGREHRRAAAANALNRNKRSIVLDLKAEAGRAIFRRLVETADVLVEGFRPGVMARLGAGYPELAALNPRLIYCSLSGFGQTGPYRDRPGHDLNYIALGGVLNLIGGRDALPAIPLNLVADYAGASLHATIAILLALLARAQTRRGQFVDVAYLDGTVALLAASPVLARFLAGGPGIARGEGVFSGAYPYYAVYEAGDGRLLTLACAEPHLWRQFCAAVGHEDWTPFVCRTEHFTAAPDEGMQRVKADVAALIRTRSCAEWLERLESTGACVAPVLTLEEVVEDQHLRERGMFLDVDAGGMGTVRHPGIPFKLSATPGRVRHPGPVRGEDTEAVLREVGLSEEEIEAARSAGAIEETQHA